jgi:hypothetical protein
VSTRPLGLAAAGFAIVGLSSCSSAPASTPATAAPITASAVAVPLTLATYGKIQDGMTLAQVQAILGNTDVATTSLPDSTPGHEDGVYMWGSPAQAAAGNGMVLGTFQGGVLTGRSEIGLSH